MTRMLPLALALSFGIPCLAQDTPPPKPEAPAEDEAGEGEGEADAGEADEGEADEGEADEGEADEGEAEGDDDEEVISPIAAALAEQLNVDPNYREGRVELVYTFRNEDEIKDWDNVGFQRAEQANAKGRRKGRRKNWKKNQTLALATSRAGLLTHKIPFLEEVEVEITAHIERGATRSDLVFGVGKAGVRFGQGFVRKGGSGFKAVERPFSEENPYAGGAKATLTLKASGSVFSAKVGKGNLQNTDKLRNKLAGRVFLYTTQAHLVVHKVVIRGEVDLEKLKLK